jgi:hypothetical protein
MCYGTFKLGEHDARVRAGRHVLNWGESLFIQGVNQINPIDVPALRRPGTEIKEVLLPVGMVSANVGLGKGVSVEGFYQFEWQNSVVDGCGTYFLAVDASVGPNARTRAARASSIAHARAGRAALRAPAPHDSRRATRRRRRGRVPARGRHAEASNSGQYGLSMRFLADALDTEFGSTR